MVFHPAIFALLVGSVLVSAMLCYSAYYGVRILRGWNIKSGSELQLGLERRTYLISTMVTYAFGFQLISLFLFVFTADHLHSLFVGAMCAAGSLNVNEYGYPTVILKMVNFLLCGVWSILNFIDNSAYDYPLIKKKYMALWMITPGILIEMVLQANYFLNMKPNIITSCCGVLFSANADAVTSGIVALPLFPVSTLFYTTMALSVGLGIFFYIRGQGAYLYSLANTVAFIVSIVALISYISLYIYELPTHHCPFDILQKEYNFVGYPLYMTLLGGTVAGLGVGVVMPFRKIKSLMEIVPTIQRRLTLTSLISYSLFMLIVAHSVIFSSLTLASI
jgi:hypothetical protein